MRGSPTGEKGRFSDEGPQHMVMIPRSFAVSKYEITRGEYARFVEATGRGERDGCFFSTGTEWKKEASKSWRDPGFSQTERDPVVCVSWDDAKAYVRWLDGVSRTQPLLRGSGAV
jgi:formylglycine-generating enzyme required for sulfatase activity